MDELKQRVLASGFGPAATGLARWLTMARCITSNPETACAAANVVIAERLVTQLCRPGAAFVDVGAHIGSILVQVHRADPSIEIVAFEAEPSKARKLQRRFPFCEVNAVAVGDRTGEITLFVNRAASGYNTTLEERAAEADDRVTVPLARLDDMIADRDLDVMKIDVEGAELGVLNGAEQIIGLRKPTIMFESAKLTGADTGPPETRIWEWLTAHGYAVMTPDRVAHDAPAMTLETFLDCHAYPPRSYDYVAVHGTRRIEIRDRARSILGLIPE